MTEDLFIQDFITFSREAIYTWNHVTIVESKHNVLGWQLSLCVFFDIVLEHSRKF